VHITNQSTTALRARNCVYYNKWKRHYYW